jgi:subtilase family serine protease
LLALTACAIAAAGMAVAPADASTTSRALPGSAPTWAKPAARVGGVASTTHVAFRVYFGWRNPTAAAALARSVSTPGSASYGKYLTAAQFRQRFGVSAADTAAVQQWLRNRGFSIDYVPGNGRYVQAEGTAGQAAKAFGTTFSRYRVHGKTLRANDSALKVPSSLPSSIVGVVGLDDSTSFVRPTAPPSAAFVNAPPCSTYWDQKDTANTPTPQGVTVPNVYGHPTPWAPCGYTPAQLRGAYGLGPATPSNDGSGQTVAIIDAYASPTIRQDVNTYSTLHGLPTLKPGQFREVVPPGIYRVKDNRAQSPSGWYGEETLDVEAVHGMAPGANIVYVGAPNNYRDLDATLNHVVDHHLASIVTNSYGFSTELLPRGYVKSVNDTAIEAAATGIGLYFSSGDDSDETGGDPANWPFATPDWPASSPWVTAVGGTSLAVGASNNYLFETGWATGRSVLQSDGTWDVPPPGAYLYGAGGGTSRLFTQPAYQAGVVPTSMATANGARPQAMRVVPDVAAVGDPNTGYLVGQTQTFPDGSVRYSEFRLGGTSLASPLYAGMIAVAQQQAGRTFGFANPLLYQTAGTSANHDVVHHAGLGVMRNDYINSVNGTDGYRVSFRSFDFTSGLTIHTQPGYDDITGIGSPNGAAWLTALSTLSS